MDSVAKRISSLRTGPDGIPDGDSDKPCDGVQPESNQYLPFFQPIVDINRGMVAGYEALARIRRDDGTVMSAGPLFSDPGVDRRRLLNIDRMVRKQALETAQTLPPDCFLTLNISPEWMRKSCEEEQVPTIRMIHEAGIDPQRVVVEFTENGGDEAALVEQVAEYRRAGLRIAIDDFGAGYSQLNRIISLEPDLIKLDMRLFKRAARGGISGEVVQSVGYLAERAGSQIICEGVETEDEFRFAMECGARYIQGYIFNPALERFLAPDAPQSKVGMLLESFIHRKVEEERRHIYYIHQMEKCVLDIKDSVLRNEDFLGALPHPPEGFLRFYICDHTGVQITPNFDWDGAEWLQHMGNQGVNWAARPYFYQMLAIERLLQRRVINSRPYRDTNSGFLCQTISTVLDSERTLLADIRYLCQ
ncbi:EAL domain-containing protein [Hahella aquimaris]|uniref:EAL domain-containing protein n=1 Tax=Hahella sp. HNIBRBA332 TaxID=3015983 RepID=UPI00273CA3AF|nr:EAL domain-containing protein [Hahella sp. HNIBRBA332]WLQ17005.1 EAL domain-containing protein [Hahella sp. HNIBRBA332]